MVLPPDVYAQKHETQDGDEEDDGVDCDGDAVGDGEGGAETPGGRGAWLGGVWH